jgi:hypothetical protein
LGLVLVSGKFHRWIRSCGGIKSSEAQYDEGISSHYMSPIPLKHSLINGGLAGALLFVIFFPLSALHAADEHFSNLAPGSSLPQGPGLATQFKADAGIGTHPAVIFADDFEVGEVGARWDEKGAGKGKALSFAPQHRRATRWRAGLLDRRPPAGSLARH